MSGAGEARTKSLVAVREVKNDVLQAVSQAMEAARWKSFIRRGADVSLKVNLGWDLFIPGSITSPLVVEGVIETIRGWVGDIYLVESDQVLEDIEKAFVKSNMHLLCEKYGVRWVNLSREETVRVSNPEYRIFKELDLPRILFDTQVITIPVMKTHDKTVITGAVKNQWGCLSKLRHGYHLVLDDALAEINSLVTPSFAVMDATVCLEGNGPKSGNPRIGDMVLASGDFVALDAVQARLMGFDPRRIKHLNNCAGLGLGISDPERIEVCGADIEKKRMSFKPARHNIVSSFELALRKSVLKKLFFDTPLFEVCLKIAKVWYYGWYLFKGRKYWAQMLSHPVYGPQWR